MKEDWVGVVPWEPRGENTLLRLSDAAARWALRNRDRIYVVGLWGPLREQFLLNGKAEASFQGRGEGDWTT